MTFNLPEFLPYLLNQAAEAVSQQFQTHYRGRYGMLRTEWRVLFHLGCYGDMTAKRICELSSIHKTKVSRAIGALEKKRYLTRTTDESDRRSENLSLTSLGRSVFSDLASTAEAYERQVTSAMSDEEIRQLRVSLSKLTRPAP